MRRKTGAARVSGPRRIIKAVSALLCAVLVYAGVSLTVPPLFHADLEPEAPALSENGTERVALITDNGEALDTRLRLIEQADSEILLCTFSFMPDESGYDMLSALLCAAERGVNVKLLTDGLSGTFEMALDPYYDALIQTPGVSAAVYNPPDALRPWRLNYRMHDKYIVCDRKLYLAGGRNTNDLFLGDPVGRKNFDRDVLVYAPERRADDSVYALADYFCSMWDSEYIRPVNPSGMSEEEAEEIRAEMRARYGDLRKEVTLTGTDWESLTYPANSVTVLANPVGAKNKEPLLLNALFGLMENGSDITIQTPYAICDGKMKGLFRSLAQGRDVRLILNSPATGANIFGCADFLNQRKKLEATGMGVYPCAYERSMHAKAVAIDDDISVIGSFNLDMRSTYLDTELMVAVDCRELNAELRAQMDEIADGYADLAGKYDMPLVKKAGYSALRVVTPLVRHLM